MLVRGPFDVRFGAFALGGSLEITTLDRPPNGLQLSVGNFDFYRGLLVYGLGNDRVYGYGSVMASSTEGYRDNNDFHQFNTFDKVLFPMLRGTGSVRLQVYNSDFGAPTYLNRELLRTGVLEPTDAVNVTDGGMTALQERRLQLQGRRRSAPRGDGVFCASGSQAVGDPHVHGSD